MSIFVETSFESLIKDGEELCGDKVEIIRNDNSVVVVLADGLGSGVKANILASMTSKICATMIDGGADIDETVSTVANTLPVCSERDLAYSTFTILQIFFDGEARLVEFDNPEAVYLRKGKPLSLEKTESLFSDKMVKESRFTVQPEDMIVIFSDGAVHAGVGKLLDLGWQWENIAEYIQRSYKPSITSKNMTKLVLSACDCLYMQKPGDDTTVTTIKIKKPLPVCVMVGPPVNGEDDKKVVQKLLSTNGKKVICGGTTSQIVSRISGEPINIKLEYFNPSVPPTAEIKGIDLVTEGVITLGKTLEYMKKYCAHDAVMEDILNIDQKDGASRLAKLLLEDSTQAIFLVGRAMNPAHQNPDLPLNLSLKLRLVEDIGKCLESLGKKVTIEYY